MLTYQIEYGNISPSLNGRRDDVSKRRVNQVSDAQIVASYKKSYSAYEVSKELDVSTSTIYRVLARHGVPRVGLEYVYAIPTRSDRKYTGSTERVADLYEDGWSLRQIAKNIGFSTTTVRRILRDEGVEVIPWGARGDQASNWRGGRTEAGQGYWRVWVADDDPMVSMRTHHGYVLEHRLILARKLGRPLLRTETVHHIDGDKANNDPANLQLRHGRHGKNVVLCCLDCGSRNIGPAEID